MPTLALLLLTAVAAGMMYLSSTETAISSNFKAEETYFAAVQGWRRQTACPHLRLHGSVLHRPTDCDAGAASGNPAALYVARRRHHD